jgi:hypothetical protein
MKPFTELTASDFATCPTWRHCGGADAAASVEPQALSAVRGHDSTIWLGATDFEFADGTRSTGFCSPEDSSGLDYVQPVIFGPNGQVPLWRPGLGAAASSAIAQDLGKTVTQAFPLAWRCSVPVDGEMRNGTVSEADVEAG